MTTLATECSICTYPFDERVKPVTGTCGHTLCINCCRAINNRKCPTCQRDYAFLDETVNYKLMELINECKEKEAEQIAKDRELELLKKQQQNYLNEMEVMRKQKSDIEKKLSQMKVEEERLNQTCYKCSECDSLIKKDQSRLCLPCCISKGIVRHDANKILNEQRAEKAVFCPSCALEGVHNEHKTVLYSKLKIKHQNAIGFDKVITSCEDIDTTGCDRKIACLRFAREELLKTLKEVALKAPSTDNTDKPKLLALFQKVEHDYKNAICRLEERIQDSIQEIESLMFDVTGVLLSQKYTIATEPMTNALDSEVQLLPSTLPKVRKYNSQESPIQEKLTALAGPIVDMLGFFQKFYSTKMKSSLTIHKFPPPGNGRFCCADNCRSRKRDHIMVLCKMVAQDEYLRPNEKCPDCHCESSNHKNLNYIFYTRKCAPISASETLYLYTEKSNLYNFIEEALVFFALARAASPLEASHSPLAWYLRWMCDKSFSMEGIYDEIIRNVGDAVLRMFWFVQAEEKLTLTQQGNRSEITPFQMEQMIDDLGKLKVAGPILIKLGLVTGNHSNEDLCLTT